MQWLTLPEPRSDVKPAFHDLAAARAWLATQPQTQPLHMLNAIGGQIEAPLAMYMADLYTVSINLSGLPAVALPCGFDSEGMPVGMQLIGKAFSEPVLVKAADIYQNNTNYHTQSAKGGQAK